MQSTATTTTETTCSRCGGTRFGRFAGPSGRARRCRDCGQRVLAPSFAELLERVGRGEHVYTPADETADDIFARIARNHGLASCTS